MPPTREQIEAELRNLPPEQHAAFLAEVERRMAAMPAEATHTDEGGGWLGGWLKRFNDIQTMRRTGGASPEMAQEIGLPTAIGASATGVSVPLLAEGAITHPLATAAGLYGAYKGEEVGGKIGGVVGLPGAGSVVGGLAGGMVGGVAGPRIVRSLGLGGGERGLLRALAGGKRGLFEYLTRAEGGVAREAEGQVSKGAERALVREARQARKAAEKATKAAQRGARIQESKVRAEFKQRAQRLAIAERRVAAAEERNALNRIRLEQRASTAARSKPTEAPSTEGNLARKADILPDGQRAPATNLGGKAKPGPAPTPDSELEDALKRSIEAAKENELRGPRIQRGAQRVGREVGLKKEEVRKLTGPVLNEAPGEASPIFPREVIEKITDTMKALPKSERIAYVARARGEKAMAQVENIRRVLDHLGYGFLLPALGLTIASEEK